MEILLCWILCWRLTVSLVCRAQRLLSANKHNHIPRDLSIHGLVFLHPIEYAVPYRSKPDTKQKSWDMQKHRQTPVSSEAERSSDQLNTVPMAHNITQSKPTRFRDRCLYSSGLRALGKNLKYHFCSIHFIRSRNKTPLFKLIKFLTFHYFSPLPHFIWIILCHLLQAGHNLFDSRSHIFVFVSPIILVFWDQFYFL